MRLDVSGKWAGRQGLSSNRSGHGASRVIPPALVEELLDTYQMWEERERKTNMVVISYWLIARPLYPKLSMSGVYEKMVSGLRTTRDDVPEQTPNRSALSASHVRNWAVRS
jgi:hypothetical protein